MDAPTTVNKKKKPFYRHLFAQVMIAIIAGVVLGYFAPATGVAMKPLGDAFIKLIKMMIGPIIFCTIISGVASMNSMKQAGSIALKALIYFLVLSVVSLFIGLVTTKIAGPGKGMNVDPTTLSTKAVEDYVGGHMKPMGVQDFFMHIIPNSPTDALASGNIIQILFFAVLFACACIAAGEKGKPVVAFITNISHILFKIIGFIMYVSPIGAFGAMAFTVGQYGIESLRSLSELLLYFYLACAFFIIVVIGATLWVIKINIFQFIGYIKEELLIVFGTSSSETVFPRMVEKLERLGCDKAVVGMVLPTGYSFNLTGTMIYLTMAAIFLAQATNTSMTFGEEMGLMAVMMLTSKGAAGVTGSGFIILASSLASIGHIPVQSIALILGIDRFMSAGRSVTNLIGNGAATILIARTEKALDIKRAQAILHGKLKPGLESETV